MTGRFLTDLFVAVAIIATAMGLYWLEGPGIDMAFEWAGTTASAASGDGTPDSAGERRY